MQWFRQGHRTIFPTGWVPASSSGNGYTTQDVNSANNATVSLGSNGNKSSSTDENPGFDVLQRKWPAGGKKELDRARAIAVPVQSHLKIDKLVKDGEERNKIAQKVAAAHFSLAKSSKGRGWLETFSLDCAD